MSFKEQLKQDLENVFYNCDEFADEKIIRYNNETCEIPVIFTQDITNNRTMPSGDHSDGIFIADAQLRFMESSFGIKPRQGSYIDVDSATYKIMKTNVERGEIILDLEMFDE